MKISRRAAPWVAAAGALLPGLCMAADMDGSTLSVLWGVPFAGILLSIALMPLLAPIFWHHHFGKVAAAWGLAFLLPFAITFGPAVAGVSLVHALLAEYIPFVILLTALFTSLGVATQLKVPILKLLLGTLVKGPAIMLQIAYFGAATPRFIKATEGGDLQNGVQMIGQVQGLIDDLPSVAELIHSLLDEARSSATRVAEITHY